MNKTLNKNCAVIVSSCDAYSDLWNPFFNSFFRHWGDCSFPIYLLTESKECEIEHIRTIKAGLDTNWSDRLKFALSYVKTDRIILILEDFLLRSKVDNHEVESYLNIASEENISALVNVSFCDTEAVMFKYTFSKDSDTKLRLKNPLCEPVIKLVNIGAGGVLNPSLQSI